MQDHNLVALVTVAALMVFAASGIGVGRARGKYKIAAPAMTGHDIFERHVRAQMNTLEQLAMFLPSLWLFAVYWGDPVAAGLGAVWVIARAAYIAAYVRNPANREIPFLTASLAGGVLFIGAAAGVIRALLPH